MSGRPKLPARPRRSHAGLLPEHADFALERGLAAGTPRRAARGRSFRLELRGLRPQDEEGPVDLTIYAPRRRAEAIPNDVTYAHIDSDDYEVLVEATLDVHGRGSRAGRARFVFRSARSDVPGIYVAVFRRTDVSSRPVAVRRFVVTR